VSCGRVLPYWRCSASPRAFRGVNDEADVTREADWKTLATWAGIVGGAVGLVYAVGAVVLLLRYAGFQFGAQTLAVTPREQILIRGGVALALWGTIGAALITVVRFGLRALTMLQKHPAPREQPRAASSSPPATPSIRGPSRLAVFIVAAVACFLVVLLAHRWWIFAALLAVPCIALAVTRWHGRPALWLPVSALAVAVVAAAYEADRLSYVVEWRCVRMSASTDTTCGVDLATKSEGVYLGQPREKGSTSPSRVVFIPSSKVAGSYTVTRKEGVTPDQTVSRRRSLLSRVFDVSVR
jgi:small neutral amino acid transporter SnatA (MarC family)